MLFWIAAALLTVGASLAVLLPLTGGDRWSAGGGHDVEVYRDQLHELDREAARGLIDPAQAEEARAEIARRLIRADARPSPAAGAKAGRTVRVFATAAVLAVPLVSWGIYGAIGSPELPSQPLSGRLAKDPAESSVEELVARAEAHLAANPSDFRGWDVLAPIYVRQGRLSEAVNAFSTAIRLDGSTALREAGLGEAIAGMAGGLVTAEAKAAFERALELEPSMPKANFYHAMALAQEGRVEDAIARWQAMLADLPADSLWQGAVEQALADGRQSLAAAPGPTGEDIGAAASLSEADRTAMIESMVAGLDERLKNEPHDLDGWFRLVRSYVVLGKAEAARNAVRRATTALGEDSDEAGRLAAFSDTLGLSRID